MKLSDILRRNKEIDAEAIKIVKAVAKNYGNDAGFIVPQRPTEKMHILQEEELEEAALASKLIEYAGWVAYFDTKCTRWAAIHDYLHDFYRGCYDDTFSKAAFKTTSSGKGNSVQDREARTKAGLVALNRATQIAKERLTRAKSNLYQASTQHKLVSRIITLKQYELQAMPERKYNREERNNYDED